MASVKDIRALHRGLNVLETLNSYNGSTLTEVSGLVQLPKATTYRILENLCRVGYVVRDTGDGRYRLTILVRRLSQGFDDSAWMTEVARPLLYELGRQVVYPVVVTTLYGTSMVARETTDHQSALALDHYAGGTLLPLFSSASGKIYLAFCEDQDRDALISLCARSNDPEHRLARDPKVIEAMTSEVRTTGYAFGLRQRTRAKGKTSTMAVPIISQGGLLACLALRYIDSAMTPGEVVERYLDILNDYAGRIGRAAAKVNADIKRNGVQETLI